jgi:S-DNA-T family DNA segregation ATPase FtsK/SpoIIIE
MKTDMQNQVGQVDRIDPSLQAALVKNQGLTVVVGRDGQGRDVVVDLAMLPHLLIGGSTGSGKSVCIKSILSQLMRTKSPDEVKFIIYD